LSEKLTLYFFKNFKDITEPVGNYRLTFALIKNCSKEGFKVEKLNKYAYEVIRGLHNMTATKALNKYPENIHFQGRHSKVYCGLNNEEMF